jgi:hypothetical protein
MSRGIGLALGDVIIAGRERKGPCGAFKAQKSGKGREDRTPRTLSPSEVAKCFRGVQPIPPIAEVGKGGAAPSVIFV